MSRRSAGAHKPLQPFTVDHFREYARKMVLDTGDPWEPEDFQLGVIEDIFAGFPEVWMIVPEGNGKTTLMGGLALYHGDYTQSPWVPIGAATRDQAKILFDQAGGFVERTRGLEKRFRVYHGYRKIDCLRTGGRGIQVYAADKDSGDGVIPTLALIDEPHRQKNMGLYRLWKGKLRKRNGQIVAISTAGEPDTEFEQSRDAMRDGATESHLDGAYLRAATDRSVMHEWMVRDPTKVTDMEAVADANPFSRITKATLAEDYDSPTRDDGDWQRLKCNRPARATESEITELQWAEMLSDEFDEIPEGEPTVVGADFAWKWDTTALVPLWMRSETYRLLGEAEILVPPRNGNTLDPVKIKAAFEKLQARNPIEAVVMDTTKAEDIASWLETEMGLQVVDRTQSNAWAVKDYDLWTEAMSNGWLFHTGDRGLRSHVLNAIARPVGEGKHRFDRPSSSRRHGKGMKQDRKVIDALTAGSMAHTFAAKPTQSAPFVMRVG